MKLNKNVIAFTGGGTGGHIYPGLAVADEIKNMAAKDTENKDIQICWIGCSKGMDKKIVENAMRSDSAYSSKTIVDQFVGIPSGKLRRYFSMENFSDMFRIVGGYFAARKILRKLKPAVLFSKGGFVSVPPCLAAKHLGIPVFTHECDFTLGLANRLNFRSAKTMFVSYEETKNRLGYEDQKRVVVTGNPVRPVFYNTNRENGLKFLGIPENHTKPILLVLGGSSGARQVNELIFENLDYLCKNYIVVHQTGLLNADDNKTDELKSKYPDSYFAFNFIYAEMPDVVSCADLILSRAGANSIWEAAVLYKPMILVPLCGSGTRGDQVDNAKFFEENNAAIVLLGEKANSENLKAAVDKMASKQVRAEYSENVRKMVGSVKPVEKIAEIIYSQIK